MSKLRTALAVGVASVTLVTGGLLTGTAANAAETVADRQGTAASADALKQFTRT